MDNPSHDSSGERSLLAIFAGLAAAGVFGIACYVVATIAQGVDGRSAPFAIAIVLLCASTELTLVRLTYLLWTDRFDRQVRIIGPTALGLASGAALLSGGWILVLIFAGTRPIIARPNYVGALGVALAYAGVLGIRRMVEALRAERVPRA
jgi:hypothetical protein